MYKVYLDGELLYHPNVKQLPIEKTKLSLEVNKTGTFKFQIRNQNKYYSSIKKMKSIISVYDDAFRLFRGRVLNTTKGMFNELQVTCEGELAFLLDSRQRPFEFTGSVDEYFTFLIERHNAYVTDPEKQFKVGRVTVIDPNDYIVRSDSQYSRTLDLIIDGLVDKLGGYLWTREEEDGVYIDYLEDFELTNTQEIKFGENLINFEEVIKGQDIATVIIPLGCKLTDEEGNETGDRLTITSVNNGLDYVFDQASVDKYGWIEKIVEWDDVQLETNLFNKAMEELQNVIHPTRCINLTAIDLHNVNCDIQSFRYGRYVKIESLPHSFNESLLVRKIELNLQNAKDGYLILGDERKTFVDHQLQTDKNLSNLTVVIQNAKNELRDYVSLVQQGLIQKIEGIDGTFFYIMYSQYSDGHVMTSTPNENTAYIGTCSTNKATAPTDYKEYTWARIRGNDGSNGTAGTDGTSSYFHVKYSNDGKTFTSNNGETLGDWLGTCVTNTEADPISFSAYTWKKIVGEDGQSGIDGVDGKDGESCYFFVKYSANSTGYQMTETPTSTTKYMGVCSTSSPTAPTDYRQYTWTQCRGNDGQNGTPGAAGQDGKTQYLHIKYSNDGETFTENNGEELGAWIGTLVDFTEADSMNFDDYTWKRFTEDVEDDLDEIRQTIVEQYTTITNDAEAIIFGALESYVETGNFESFKEETEAALKLMSDEMTLKFTETTTQLTNTNNDLQEKFNKITTWFKFNIDGFAIGKVDSPFEVVIDDDRYSMLVNGVEVLWLDPDGKSNIPSLVTKLLNLCGYVIEAEGEAINCGWVGDN